MTGPCSGAGVGQPKAGFAALQYIGPGAIGGALASLSGWQGAGVGAAIGALTFDLTTFCPGGPPANPTFTIGDIAALLSPVGSPDKIAASIKFRDFLGNVFWPILCECSSGTPVISSPAPYPSGGPGVYPPIGVASGVCVQRTGQLTTISSTSGNHIGGFVAGVTGKQNIIHTHIDTHGGGVSTVVASVQMQYTEYSGGPTLNMGGLRQIVRDQVYDYYDLVPSQTVFNVTDFCSFVSGTGSLQIVTDMYNFCNGSPLAPSPCCPPDSSTQASLDAILEMVTLIQRQAVPFAYLTGTVHTALSGSGSISISGLLGASAHCTTIPASYGREGTTPTEYFGLGFITFGTPDGFPTAYKLERETLLMLPARCSAYTQIDYDLSPGVVVTLTELVREP